MVQLKNRPPTLKEKDWVHITNILLNNAEVTEPAAGLRTEDQLHNHLQEYCLNRTQLDSKEDLPEVVLGLTMVIIILFLINFIIII